MSDKLDFLGAPATPGAEDVAAAIPAAVPADTAAPAAAPERGSDGRFASRAPEAGAPAPAAEAPAAAPGASVPAAEPGHGHVPLSALLDERFQRQAEKTQREALQRQLDEARAQASPPRQLEPTEQLQAELYAQNLRASRRFADREYGKETIATVHQWAFERCDQASPKFDPVFNQQMRASEDPYESAYQAYNREQILQTVKPTDLEAFKAWQAAQAAAGNPSAPPQSAPAPPPPRSLATASGTGGAGAPHTPIGPGLAFANAINR